MIDDYITHTFPKIDADKWILRKYSNEDLALVEAASKDSLIPLITSIPDQYSQEAGCEFIKRQVSRYKEKIGYSFAIADKQTNQAIGGFYLNLKDINDGKISLGYLITKPNRKQGAGKASLKAASTWAHQELKIPRLELYIAPTNLASVKTAKSVGYKEEELMRSWQLIGGKRQDMLMFSLINNQQ